ncbi:tRNA (guanosine(37)-N1)-methyltransferase TrmD [Candidatus Saccharibacteria bacterium]|nr:tRNA (guanosine(37)-N1)-methyltransferase TrmD [Candidatus Saccharibacteria bacterium]
MASKLKFTIITLFPEAMEPYLNSSMLYKAQDKGLVEYELVNLRNFGLGPHKSVDDTPYGGGDGMLLMCEPVFNAIESIKAKSPDAKVILPTPAGEQWTQEKAKKMTTGHYIILCPHYEGYDQRIMTLVDYPISLGHYVLTGGELPALVIVDSVTRLVPGVLGGETSAEIESFSDGDNIEYPQYTKPADFRGLKVPDVLLSGHHGEIAKWRQQHTKKAQ